MEQAFTDVQPTEQLTVDAAPAVMEDRRRSDRSRQCMPAWVSGDAVDRGSRGSQVIVTSLSMHGVGFRDPRTRYRVGAAHWVVVSGVSSMRISSRVKIVSCRENEQGGYDVGAAFF
ncbi:MAG: hypothetical protein QM770_05120 [Tepidisphaeraceae bacterium]